MPRKDHQAHLASCRAYYKAHRDTVLENQRLFHLAHPEVHKANRKRANLTYARKHPEVHQAKEKRRRARKSSASINDFTHQQWIEMQVVFNHRCAYCHGRFKGRLTQDHIVPLISGGNHTYSNIVPACRSCNSKKGIQSPMVPIQPVLLLENNGRVSAARRALEG